MNNKYLMNKVKIQCHCLQSPKFNFCNPVQTIIIRSQCTIKRIFNACNMTKL